MNPDDITRTIRAVRLRRLGNLIIFFVAVMGVTNTAALMAWNIVVDRNFVGFFVMSLSFGWLLAMAIVEGRRVLRWR